MTKYKNVAITEAARQAAKIAPRSLAERRVAALTAEGDRIAASLLNGHQRSLQLVSTEGHFSALIKHGTKVFQFDGDSFAITTHDD